MKPTKCRVSTNVNNCSAKYWTEMSPQKDFLATCNEEFCTADNILGEHKYKRMHYLHLAHAIVLGCGLESTKPSTRHAFARL